MTTLPILHGYFRSSTSTRVRAALNFKGIDYHYEALPLREGAQKRAAYLALNPQGLVPTLVMPDGVAISQSLAIVEYLEETVPEPPLLPADPAGRARVRSLALAIACEVHPLNNLKVLNHLRATFGADDAAVAAWFRHFVAETFGPLETRLAGEPATGRFCHGDRPGLADLTLFAQVLNNRRFDVDMGPYPTIRRIHEACLEIPAFVKAMPENQPDAE